MTANQNNKELAVQFLKQAVAGDIDEAYQKYVDMNGKHHNAFFAAGFPSLKKAMKENNVQFPNKQLTIKNVVGDGDIVAVHSHLILKPNDPGMVVVHLLRFKNDKIYEMWDCGQAIPADCPNKDGVF